MTLEEKVVALAELVDELVRDICRLPGTRNFDDEYYRKKLDRIAYEDTKEVQ